MSDLLGGMFGVPAAPEPSRNLSLAVLLRHLADLLEADETPAEPERDGRATEPEEVRVRPRIEPLGG
jgi:hypothetical protein